MVIPSTFGKYNSYQYAGINEKTGLKFYTLSKRQD